MKNLKLFVAPLLGATLLLTACGPKAMKVEDFRAKVVENYKFEAIQTKYKGGTMKMSGTDIEGDESIKIVDVKEKEGIAGLVFGEGEFKTEIPFTILCPAVVDATSQFDANVNYFISGGTYTIDVSMKEKEGQVSMKIAFNSDLVISRLEAKGPQDGKQVDIKYNFKYEL